ncbi:MAG: hypothetical protein HGB12_16805 [Bacteroidetes bacterium]|nr:hypothetical protein [Bacteroidota bacterium]
MKKFEDSLKVLGKIIVDGHTDFIKYNANEKFLTLLESALLTEKSFDYPFDSLTTIARLTSPDNKLKIFNWNLRKTDDTYEYFGFIQAWSEKEKKYKIFPLNDSSETILNPDMQILSNLRWYGAHYYKLIQNKSGKKIYYTLLGWDGNDKLTQKKIIDILYFKSGDKPMFGSPMFRYNKKIYKRMIFEYSSTVSMSLKYEKQYMLHGKKKAEMIVFDRVSPLNTNLAGQYQFYFPETNVFDAFIFKNGKWDFLKEVDARLPKESKQEKQHRKEILKEQKEHSK